MHLLLLPLLLSTFLLLPGRSLSLSASTLADVSRWCSHTPHPAVCLHYLSQSPKHSSDLYRLSLQAALRLAVRAQSHVRRLRGRCHSKPQRSAWLDCWRLYANTILQLNRTLHPTASPCSSLDTQTWLSAALTNLATCRRGFHEMGQSPEVIEPVLKYNISELISNCLAINKPPPPSPPPALSSTELPQWTSTANRKLLQLSSKANAVVAKDGSGNFNTIKAALDAAAAAQNRNNDARFVIYAKAGVYNENIQIVSSLNNITLVGDGIGRTIITGSRSVAGGYTTFSSSTFIVFGDGFTATGVTFRNTFGPGSQAVSLLSGSDRSVFYKCSFEGYQDTLYVYSQRQFFRECTIYGTIDFIFGNAAAVFQNCNIFLRRPRLGEANVITAQGRIDPNQNTGLVIQSSAIRGLPELWEARKKVKSYLGRPWMRYSRTVCISNYIESVIDPAGWLQFNGNFALDTLDYVEFRNYGAGARLSKRVKWPGFHIVARPSLVAQFTVGNFLAGGDWIRAAGVPFNSGL